MTRKITLSIILILLIFGCFEVVFGSNETIRSKIASVRQLEQKSKELNQAVANLELKTNATYDKKKEELETAIKNYNLAKTEYDELVPDVDLVSQVGSKDTYDVSFLWTTIGNYATEEGVLIKMDIGKNTTSASSLQNSSTSEFIVCDLKFVATGKYINLASFIQNLEDDDRLGFEINNFDMQKSGEDLQVTLTVKEVKVNSKDLIESGITSSTSTATGTSSTGYNSDSFNVTADEKAINSAVQTIDSATTNTTYKAN